MTANADNDNRSIVALDFGLRRIGVATGSCITGAASPLDTIRAKAGEPDWRQLDKIIREWQPDVIVLGLPYNSDGSDSEMTEIVRNFGATLIPRFEIPIEFVDERYTSAEAETLLKEDRRLGVRNKKLKKEDIDAKAAQLIAESWMRSTGG